MTKRKNTGIVYDGRMCRHAHPKQMHPEQPLRIERIYKSIVKVFGPPQTNLSNLAEEASTIDEDSFNLLARFHSIELDDGVNFDSSSDEDDSVAAAEDLEDGKEVDPKSEIVDINPFPFPDIVRLNNDVGISMIGTQSPATAVIITQSLVEIPVRRVTFDELALTHDSGYLQSVKDFPDLSLEELCDIALRFNSIYLCKESLDCALLSCGGVIEAVKQVIEGKVENAFAIVRPPGHHAEAHCAMGFCLFNNVAVAAQVALTHHAMNVKKVLILDWDVHHGNGTQHAFYDNPNVLYISLHRYDDGLFYPNSKDGNYDKIGSKSALGRNINVAWSKGAMGDSEYLYAFDRVIVPVVAEFDPDLVIVSAGFDAAINDPIGGCCVTPIGYARMTHALKSMAKGKMVIALEGGYNLNSISASAVACVSVLLGNAPPTSYSYPVDKTKEALPAKLSAVQDVENTLSAISPYWNCLFPKYKSPALFKEMEKLAHFSQNVISLGSLMPRIYGMLAKDASALLQYPLSEPYLKDLFGDKIFTTEDLLTNTQGTLISIHDMPRLLSEKPMLTSSIDSNAGNIFLYESIFRLHKTCKYSKGIAIMDIITQISDQSQHQSASTVSWEMSNVYQLLKFLKHSCWDHCSSRLIFIVTGKNCRIFEALLRSSEFEVNNVAGIIWVPGEEDWCLSEEKPGENGWHSISRVFTCSEINEVSFTLASNYQNILDIIDEKLIFSSK